MPDYRKVDALLRFHYGVDPNNLEDVAYWQLWGEYDFVHEQQRALHLGVMRTVLTELLGKVK